MAKPLVVDLFAEDRAHEEWLRPLIRRVALEESQEVEVRSLSVRGGHGKALSEFRTYQATRLRQATGDFPDLVVVAIDGNCSTFAKIQKEIDALIRDEFQGMIVKATPDPHIERWFLADLTAFNEVVGVSPKMKTEKCERDYYKSILSGAIVDAGHPLTLGGIEFASELVEAIDLYRAGKVDSSFKHFIESLRSVLRSG
jgi:hypothetical protein